MKKANLNSSNGLLILLLHGFWDHHHEDVRFTAKFMIAIVNLKLGASLKSDGMMDSLLACCAKASGLNPAVGKTRSYSDGFFSWHKVVR